MTAPVIPFTVEPMTLADIPAVVAIDHLSYSMHWPARAYDYELQQNEFAHYFVLRTTLLHPPHLTSVENPGGQPPVAIGLAAATIIGLSGFWLLADEAHIGTVAIHPDWRGLGLGEWLLLHLLEAGQTLGATIATLEVRPSNRAALALYARYGFEQVGRRPGYYDDNNEDALILTTPPLILPDYRAMLAQRYAAVSQRLANLGQNCGILGGEGRLS